MTIEKDFVPAAALAKVQATVSSLEQQLTDTNASWQAEHRRVVELERDLSDTLSQMKQLKESNSRRLFPVKPSSRQGEDIMKTIVNAAIADKAVLVEEMELHKRQCQRCGDTGAPGSVGSSVALATLELERREALQMMEISLSTASARVKQSERERDEALLKHDRLLAQSDKEKEELKALVVDLAGQVEQLRSRRIPV